MSHSPTPWKIYQSRQYISILAADGAYVVEGFPKGPSLGDDAAFIVMACNAHEALVEALAMLIREAGHVADDHHEPRYTRLDEAIQLANAALATVEKP